MTHGMAIIILHNYFGSMSDVAFKMLHALIHNFFLWATKEMASISEMVKKQEGSFGFSELLLYIFNLMYMWL